MNVNEDITEQISGMNNNPVFNTLKTIKELDAWVATKKTMYLLLCILQIVLVLVLQLVPLVMSLLEKK
jgi:hypothetical protein